MVLLMKNQKRSRIFRALLCSSAAMGMASQVFGQDGVSRVASQPPMPDPIGGQDGVASTANQNAGTAQVPNYALPEYIPPVNTGYQVPARTTWQDELGPRYLMETRIGDWLGSDDNGDSAVNVILPFNFGSSNSVVFLDGRGTVSWDGGAIGSIGGGLRTYNAYQNRITGVSAFWDYDNGNEESYNQIGVSFESIGRWVDIRANGYFGIGDETNVISTTLTGNVIPGPMLMAEANQRIETQYSGFNVELGGPTPLLGRYGFDTYVGGYYFDTDDADEVLGVSVRMEASVTDDVRLGLNVTHDSVFDTAIYGTVSLTLPDGRPQTFFRPRKVVDKILDRVERRYRVTTDQSSRTTAVPVTTMMVPPMGGTPGGPIAISNIIVVDPMSTTNGVGSFEDPFNTFIGIPNPAPNTLTLVRSGDVQGQYNLSGNSLLLSEAFLNQQSVMVTTPLGPLMLPALNAAATTPVWSNPAGNATGTGIVNILGDNTEIAGFIFDGTTTTGLANTIIQANRVQGVSIHDNTFRNYNTAINLQNVTGQISTNNPTQIFSNRFYGSTGQSFQAFNLENDGTGTLDLEFGSTGFNLATSNGSATGNVAFGNTGEDANGNGLLDAGEDTNGNFQLDTGVAYSVTARNRAIINARIVGNSAGVEADTDGDGVLDTEDLNGNGILDAGEDVNGNGVLDFGEDLNQNGRFDIGSGTGFVINAGATQSAINLSFIGNTADRNIGDGVRLEANSSTLNADGLGEDVNGNGVLDGFEDTNRNGRLDLSEDTNGNGVLDLTEDANGNGILDPGEDTNGNGLLDLSEDRNGNGRLDLSEDTNGNGRLDFGEDANEDTNGNGQLDTGEDLNGDGFLNLGNGDGNLDGGFLISGNSITRNGGDGIRVDSTNVANVDLRLVANNIGTTADRSTGNTGIGLNITSDSGTTDLNLGFLYFEDVNLNGILDPGEDVNRNGFLDAPLNTNGNQIIANGGGGVNFGLTGTAQGTITAINNTILGTGGGSLGFTVTGDPAATPAFDTLNFPFDMSNTSDAGIDISRILWNLAPAGVVVDGSTTQFAIANGSDVTTGLQSVNGTSNPFTVADLATSVDLVFNSFNPINNILDGNEDANLNQILDAGEDANGNGLLDFGEDLNMNGILDPGEDLPDTFSFTVDLQVSGGATPEVLPANLVGSRIDVTFSTGQQVTGLLQTDPTNANQAIFVPDGTTLAATNGFGVSVADNATLQSSLLLFNQINDFGGDGVSIAASGEGTLQNILLRQNTITQNFGIGANLRTTGANSMLTASLIDNTMTSNTLGGITAAADGGTLILNDIERNSLDGGGSGISLTATQSGNLSARITNNALSNSMIMNGSSGNGVEVTADGATVTLLELADNAISNNAGDGVLLQAINSGTLTIPPSEDLNNNGVLDPGEDANEDVNMNGILDAGEDVNTDGQLNVGNGNGRLDRGVTNNNISNNAGESFTVNASAATSLTPSTVNLGSVNRNQVLFNTAGTGGFAINGVNSNITGSFTGNIVTGDPTANPTAGPGFLVSTSGGSFDINIGGPNATDGNTVSLTRGAGIAFVMTDTGTGAFTIQNNRITSVADDNNTLTPFEGDGISISLVGSDAVTPASVTLTRSDITDNIIGDFTNQTLGTAGSGISVLLSENTTIQDLLIARNMIGSPGNDNTGATTNDAGIEFNRFDDARLDAVNPRTGDLRAVTIDGNIVRGNFVAGTTPTTSIDGLFLNVMNGIRDDIDFDIRNNEFSGHTGEGVHFNTQADASLAADLTSNLIENNALNGISMTGVEIISTDLETQGGTWSRNIIRNNVLNGISIDAVSGTVIPLVIGLNGNDPFTGESLGNLIEGNGGDGIDINAGGAVQINNNIIARNNSIGVDIDAFFIGTRTALLQNNSITNNGIDGLEVLSHGSSSVTIVALGNSIDNNTGRGVDLLNRASAGGLSPELNVQFGDGTLAGMNRIASNGEEGFYVVTTNASTQSQTNNSSVALATGGNLFADPDTVLDINRNEIVSNNNLNFDTGGAGTPNPNPFVGGGLALRVGTSNGTNGGSTTIADTTGDIFGDGSGFGSIIGVGANSATFGNGRMNARVINNTFEGNLGDDVYIESFNSTVDPATTAGTWDAMAFTVMTYQTDPLARLNLVFRGNVGNSLNVTNVGAFYANAEAVFKSRLGGMTNPPGPFTSGTRRRNAQRVPVRGTGVNQLPPTVSPDNGAFQYPGMGASTFRIESDFDVSGFQSGDTFFLDGTPIPPTFNANGIFLPGTIVGEQPFGWGTAAPGSFQFDAAFIGVAP